jgi:hypothetical protein
MFKNKNHLSNVQLAVEQISNGGSVIVGTGLRR